MMMSFSHLFRGLPRLFFPVTVSRRMNCLISVAFDSSSPCLLRMHLVIGCLSRPLLMILIVLKTSLLLFCCMLFSICRHWSLNHFSLSPFRLFLTFLVSSLYNNRRSRSFRASFLALFLGCYSKIIIRCSIWLVCVLLYKMLDEIIPCKVFKTAG